jgi:hypothetical protein
MIAKTPDIPAYYDSMAACSSDLGIPVGVLKRAKATGSDAFRSNRVDMRKLLVWLATKGAELPEVDIDTANTYVALERAELLRIEKEEKKKLLMSYDAAMERITAWFLPIRQQLLSLPSEMAARVNPIDPTLARKQLDEWVRKAMRSVQEAIKNPEAPKDGSGPAD